MRPIKDEIQRYPEYERLDRDQCHHELKAIGQRLSRLSEETRDQRKRNMAIRDRIARLNGTSTGLGITDHALVRYLERVKGVDISGLRDEIRALAAANGRKIRYNSQIGGDDIERLIIHEDRLVTVLPDGLPRREKPA